MRETVEDELAAEEVVDKLIGVKRPWYVRFILGSGVVCFV